MSPTQTQPSHRKAWSKAISQSASEFPLTPIEIISGIIPLGLRGTLYRNGPGRLTRGTTSVGHWFDGDGAILALHFTDEGVTGIYRYVETEGYLKESKAGKYLYSNYGMIAPSIWERWGKPPKNSANTSVMALPNKLLALWEGGKPYALDLQTLTTWGEDDLGGLKNNFSYSAHYKRDPVTGKIFNFGMTIKNSNSQLHLYQSNPDGKIVQQSAFSLKGIPLCHDFVLAGPYLVFFISPIQLNILPLLAGLGSYSHCLEWKPSLGTRILIFDQESLSLVSQIETEPWFQWHFSNGYVAPNGNVIVDVVRYEDFAINQRLQEIATGQTHTKALATLWQVCLDVQNSKVIRIEEILDYSCEFPVVSQLEIGQYARSTYLCVHTTEVDATHELYNTIARFDTQTQTLTIAKFGENYYPVEPIYVIDRLNPSQSWVLTVVYNGNRDASEVWIFDRDRLDDEPVCKLGLPSVIPIGFHGVWKAQ